MAFDEARYGEGGYRTALGEDLYARLGLQPGRAIAAPEVEEQYRRRRRWWVRVSELYNSGRRHGYLEQAGPLAQKAQENLEEAREVLLDPRRRDPHDRQRAERWADLEPLVDVAIAGDGYLTESAEELILQEARSHGLPPGPVAERIGRLLQKKGARRGTPPPTAQQATGGGTVGAPGVPSLELVGSDGHLVPSRLHQKVRHGQSAALLEFSARNVGGGSLDAQVSSDAPWLVLVDPKDRAPVTRIRQSELPKRLRLELHPERDPGIGYGARRVGWLTFAYAAGGQPREARIRVQLQVETLESRVRQAEAGAGWAGALATLLLSGLLLESNPRFTFVAQMIWPLIVVLSAAALGTAFLIRRGTAGGRVLAGRLALGLSVLAAMLLALSFYPFAGAPLWGTGTPAWTPLATWLLLSALPWPIAQVLVRPLVAPRPNRSLPIGIGLPALLAAVALLAGSLLLREPQAAIAYYRTRDPQLTGAYIGNIGGLPASLALTASGALVRGELVTPAGSEAVQGVLESTGRLRLSGGTFTAQGWAEAGYPTIDADYLGPGGLSGFAMSSDAAASGAHFRTAPIALGAFGGGWLGTAYGQSAALVITWNGRVPIAVLGTDGYEEWMDVRIGARGEIYLHGTSAHRMSGGVGNFDLDRMQGHITGGALQGVAQDSGGHHGTFRFARP